jgi:drug/metabolite transporter (DMT)-like permease
MRADLRPHILLFTVNLLYAGNYTIAKFAMPAYISPEALVVIRAATGALFFLAVHLVWIREKIDMADWSKLILCGLTGVAVNQMMFFKGLSITQPINAALIMITVPIIVMVIASFFLREKITLFKIMGVLSGLSGAAMIIVSGEDIRSLVVSRGDLFILINATSYAFYLVMVKSLMVKYEAFTVMRWVFFFGFFMVLPFGMFQISDVDWQHLPAIAWRAIIYVLIGVTILTYLLNAMALQTASTTMVSTYIYLQPLLATLIAIGFGKDILTGQKVSAGLLIFLGVYLVSSRPQRSDNEKAEG